LYYIGAQTQMSPWSKFNQAKYPELLVCYGLQHKCEGFLLDDR